MWAVSGKYLETLSRPHDQVGYIEILRNGQTYAKMSTGYVTDPATGLRSYMLGGSISVSRTSVHRSGSIQMIDPSGLLASQTVNDLYAPYITEIRPWVGVRYWDAPYPAIGGSPFDVTYGVTTSLMPAAGDASGTGDTKTAGTGGAPGQTTTAGAAGAPASGGSVVTITNNLPTVAPTVEYVPLGTLVITHVETSYPMITLNCYDRAWYLSNFTAPYTITAGTPVNEALINLLSLKMPAGVLSVNIPDTSYVVPGLIYDADSSVADAIAQIAACANWQVYPDQLGTWQAIQEPSTDRGSMLTYTSGPGGMLYRPVRTIGSDTPYNAVVATSEGALTTPIHGYAEDDDPASLTYAKRIGIHPLFISNPGLTDQGAVDGAARAKLQSLLGLSNSWAIPIVPNHALDVNDVIHVTDSHTGVDTDMIIDSMPIPLRASDGVQTLSCRQSVSMDTIGDGT